LKKLKKTQEYIFAGDYKNRPLPNLSWKKRGYKSGDSWNFQWIYKSRLFIFLMDDKLL
jgi:hypothetical protein